MKKFIPFAVAAAFALGACASGGGTGTSSSSSSSSTLSEADAQTAIMAAEHELKRAKASGYEWRDTGKLIKEANEALKGGDFDKAAKLANKAKQQSSSALAQYEEQKNAGPHF